MAKKILIVEDNPANMRLIRMVLGSKGYELLVATDGEEALAVAMKGKPDLIVMDIQLPKMDGLEVTRRLRLTPQFKETPIIALTASVMAGDREEIIAAGCDEYISKPVNTRRFLQLVAKMLRGGDDGGKENTGN